MGNHRWPGIPILRVSSNDRFGFKEEAKFYKKFVTGPFIDYTSGYLNLKADLEAGNSPCNEGYRVPNVREGALMALYCDDWNDNYTYVSTYLSLGALGKNYFPDGYTSWSFTTNHGTVAPNYASKIRQVKDVKD